MTDGARAEQDASAPGASSTAAGRASARPAAPARRSRRAGLRTALEVTFFVTPALVVFGVFVVWPVIKAVQYSLYSWKGYGPLVDFVGLRNFAYVLTNDVFTDALVHNLIIMVVSIVVQLPLGLGIALLLNRRIHGQGLLRTIVFVPYVLSEVIAGVIWRQLLTADYGLVDTVAGSLGIPTPEQGFLGDPRFALGAVMVVLTWKYLGLAVVLFLAGLQGVPDELHEAAQLDGATWWQTQRRITIPLLGPTIRTWAFLSMIGSIQVFDMVWILTKGGPAESTNTMATFLYSWGVDRNLIGIASAASVVLFVVALVFAIAYQRLILRRDLVDAPRSSRRRTRRADREVAA
ncbi:sugar ABC transporter permease [Actinotalea sp. M2MS4P-6]|uniref:carbohydrate ABC transporter permease n=1 Tax=Actinotalea sp. M2MS4P-6 TaxID=2983762 RepID=UPI0021E4AF04|nr:sugar ABC transporter permease [Actinotalea sp. M2MS4P-6]MCV2395012.1 sugar ABC transporter permease [Actinotalea sp. M2MS4P-6]